MSISQIVSLGTVKGDLTMLAEPRASDPFHFYDTMTKHLHHRRIWLVGGGPLEVMAQEIAMKVKGTSYLQAEGMSSEAIQHGPFQCVEPEDLFLLLAPAGAAQERLFPLAAMIKDIGASYLVIDDGSATGISQDADGHCSAPIVPEPYNALPCLVLLQLFCYHLALGVGTNPDGFRLEDPRFPPHASAFSYKREKLPRP